MKPIHYLYIGIIAILIIILIPTLYMKQKITYINNTIEVEKIVIQNITTICPECIIPYCNTTLNCTKDKYSDEYVLSLIRQIKYAEFLVNKYNYTNCDDELNGTITNWNYCQTNLTEMEVKFENMTNQYNNLSKCCYQLWNTSGCS